MTVRLSGHRVSRILRDYFRGSPQMEIAAKVAVDQSCISLYASRLRQRAEEIGLPAAAKEVGVSIEVDELRSLSVELYKSGLTVAEAKKGVNIIRAFLKLGISPDEHAVLVKVCREVGDPGFVQAALKLSKIEQSSHLAYEDVLSRFEKTASQLRQTEKQLKMTQSGLKSAGDALAGKKHELAAVESQLVASQKKVKAEEQALEQQLAIKKNRLDVQDKEVDELARLKVELAKQRVDIPTVIQLAKEFSNESSEH